jgi:hypothetical protein
VNLPKGLEKEMNESIYAAIKLREKQDEEANQNKGKLVVKVNKKMPDRWKQKKAPAINFADIPIWQIRQTIYSTNCENNMIYIYNDGMNTVGLQKLVILIFNRIK